MVSEYSTPSLGVIFLHFAGNLRRHCDHLLNLPDPKDIEDEKPEFDEVTHGAA